MKTGQQPRGKGTPMGRKGQQQYVADHQRTKTKVYIVVCSRRFREGPVHKLEPLQSEDTELVLTHISIQRKLIAYDPLAIACLGFLVLRSRSLHEGGNGSYNKCHKRVGDTDSDSPLGIVNFDPASLV